MSTLNSLGLGSDGVLTYDIMDQLREVDEAGHVTPIETKITTNETKTTDLSVLTDLAASLMSSAKTLSEDTTFLTRSISNNGSSANVTVESGAAVQDFSIDVQSLATRDIYQSISFTSESSTFASEDDTLTIDIGSDSYDMEVTSTTTLTELKDLINDNSDGKVVASILDVGGDNPYKLIIKSADTGEDNAISFSSSATDSTLLSSLGLDTNTYVASTPIGAYDDTDTLTFTINNNEYTIDVEIGDTTDDINTKIQALTLSAGDELTSIVDVDTGVLSLSSNDSDISVSGSSTSTFGLDSLTKQSGNIQEASDSSLLYNGISISRSSNTVDDLISGVSISLVETGTTTVDITQNTEEISENINSFITSYNELLVNLTESLKYDSEADASGTFQGVSQIVSLKSTISRDLMTPDNEGRSLLDYGISLDDDGYLELDSDTFNTKMSEDSSDVEEFFTGYTNIDTTTEYDGYFTKLYSTMSNYIDGDDSILGLYEIQLATQYTNLEEQKEKAIESLDNKYEIMATRWASYDSMISGYSTQMTYIEAMIEAQYTDE